MQEWIDWQDTVHICGVFVTGKGYFVFNTRTSDIP